MQFELTDALVDDILFSMEDQMGEFLFDTVEGVVCGGIDGLELPDEEEEDESNPRFIPLPEWDSASGFRLMERFASGFRNPLIRQELSSALNRGKGVFRAFKDALGRYPEAEKLWFVFKEREMKRAILRWYDGLREKWGLEKIGQEPEETEDLVLEDFCFRPFTEEDLPRAKELHSFCQEEHRNALLETGTKNSTEILIRESQVFYHSLNNLFNTKEDFPLVAALTAESGSSEFAGFISGVAKESAFYIQCLEVKPEFRGLGVGEALLAKFLESLERDDITEVFLDLPSWAEDFSRVLLRESFKPYTVRYWLKKGE